MVASGKSCDGPEPKCGSKMLWGGLCGGFGLVGVILLIVAFTSTVCVCGDNSSTWCKDPDGCISGGAWWALVLFGCVFCTLANVFICGVCACCCFAPEAGAAGAAPAAAAPVAAPVAAPAAPVAAEAAKPE